MEKVNRYNILDVIIQIKKIIIYCEKRLHSEVNGDIYISNGDILKFRIPRKLLPKMLGININQVKNANLYKTENYYEILKRITEEPTILVNALKSGKLDYDKVFDKDAINRIESFLENIKVFNRNYILAFNPEDGEYDYTLIKQIKNQLLVMKLIIDENENYIPAETYAYDAKFTKDIFIKELNGKEIGFVYFVNTPKSKKHKLTEETVEERINYTNNIGKTFGATAKVENIGRQKIKADK